MDIVYESIKRAADQGDNVYVKYDCRYMVTSVGSAQLEDSACSCAKHLYCAVDSIYKTLVVF